MAIHIMLSEASPYGGSETFHVDSTTGLDDPIIVQIAEALAGAGLAPSTAQHGLTEIVSIYVDSQREVIP